MGGGGGRAPFINLVTRWRWSASRPGRFITGKEPQHTLNRGPSEPQKRSGRAGEEEILLPLPGIELRFVGRRTRSSVTILTELSLLQWTEWWSVGKVVECGSVGTRRSLGNSEKCLRFSRGEECRCAVWWGYGRFPVGALLHRLCCHLNVVSCLFHFCVLFFY
jgi:hypothetical protein